jgi:phosphatidylglycerol---prolipoprotein diacylglyceryl transferase
MKIYLCKEKLLLASYSTAAAAIQFNDLGLEPIALDLGYIKLRWYSLGYIAAIVGGWWYLMKLIALPGAPMAKRHADDFVFTATLGIIIGGRVGYALFYRPSMLTEPLEFAKLWEGGMSFHGGLIGLIVSIWAACRREKLSTLRFADYIAVVAPLGPLFVRPANFVNGELWGRVTDVSWGIVFPGAGPLPRHPSQLYEMMTEGALVLAIMAYFFFRTDARYYPGRLLGISMLSYGVFRTFVEEFRAPDIGFEALPLDLTMGQMLSIPMIAIGFWLIATSKARRVRVEGFAGSTSIA